MILKADDFEIGTLIIGMGTVESYRTHTTPFGDQPPVQIKNCQDNRHNHAIYKIIGIMLPYISIEKVWNEVNVCIGSRELADTRRFLFMKVTKEFYKSLTVK